MNTTERARYNTTQLSKKFSSDALRIEHKLADLIINALRDNSAACNKTQTTIQVQNSGKLHWVWFLLNHKCYANYSNRYKAICIIISK